MTNQIRDDINRNNGVSTKKRVQVRLKQYWKIERVNIFLLPIVANFIVLLRYQEPPTLAFVMSMVATAWMLVVGTIALRMMHSRIEQDLSYQTYWLPKLDLAQLPSLGLVVISGLLTFLDVINSFPTMSAARIAAIGFTLLAILEYLNYFHYQLQHFDNASDFQRLYTGKGFRKSHLARSLAKWRKSQRCSGS